MKSLALPHQPDFDAVTELTLRTVSEKSRRIYADTFGKWADWCSNTRVNMLEVHALSVLAFLDAQDVSSASAKRMLSTMRKLAQTLVVVDHANSARVAAKQSLDMIQAPKKETGETRRKIALSPDQVDTIMQVWAADTNQALRNRAMLWLLAGTGVRRAEAAPMRWMDIDLSQSMVIVRHGKGDKERAIGILAPRAVDALEAWRERIPTREVVFPHIEASDAIAGDVPITDQAVYNVVVRTATLSGIDFTPHDLRRTIITELLRNGAMLVDVQAQAGHDDPKTTLRYAQQAGVHERQTRLKTRY